MIRVCAAWSSFWSTSTWTEVPCVGGDDCRVLDGVCCGWGLFDVSTGFVSVEFSVSAVGVEAVGSEEKVLVSPFGAVGLGVRGSLLLLLDLEDPASIFSELESIPWVFSGLDLTELSLAGGVAELCSSLDVSFTTVAGL